MIEVLSKNAIVDFGSNNLTLTPGMLSGDKVGYFMIQDSAGCQVSMLFDNKETIFNVIDGLRELSRIMDCKKCKDQ